MICPKCGFEQTLSNEECPSCGIIFSKYVSPSNQTEEIREPKKSVKLGEEEKNILKEKMLEIYNNFIESLSPGESTLAVTIIIALGLGLGIFLLLMLISMKLAIIVSILFIIILVKYGINSFKQFRQQCFIKAEKNINSMIKEAGIGLDYCWSLFIHNFAEFEPINSAFVEGLWGTEARQKASKIGWKRILEENENQSSTSDIIVDHPSGKITTNDLIDMIRSENPYAPIVISQEVCPVDISEYPELNVYADSIVKLRTNNDPFDNFGLYNKEKKIRKIGEEINKKHGMIGMQAVWGQVKHQLGPHATSALTRIWDGLGQWRR